MRTFTLFWDMSSGGGDKEPWSMIFIEAPKDQAKSVFYSKFGHNPDRVTCTCCGPDYSTSEHEVENIDELIQQYTIWNRKGKEFKFIFEDEITQEEREATVPQSGYVWVD